ncbi:fumarylacetoacetate hydrolase [Colletotrichum truncatum]|uniref:Fumarylacetoacetate hydrolase n=1 Tax=Colletotrichum truncatum TaxID=5467 RepID=A0ACC3ZB52_COLTU|nr:fumarylacetoacetate hydrolase [Colletotrichum truncatum]KAF6787672.1 fumarylacetoacetate hydrolase [Colletotrichum truncatum]
MSPSRLHDGQEQDEKPPSYDQHLAESTLIASSSVNPPDLWRSRAASVNLGRPGPSDDLQRAISAPARDGKENPGPSIDSQPTLDPGLLELPPEYMRQDPNDQVFLLQPPFISSAPTDAGPMVPRFQLAQLRTSTNKPYKLRLRRLTTNECRRLTVPGKEKAFIEFDDDLTMYLIANTHALFPWSLPEIEIRGCKARTLPGFVELKKTATSYQFWHITRNEANDMLRPENQRRMEKYGYHAKDEIARELLFAGETVALLSKDTKWRDGNGVCVATESKGKMSFVVDLPAQMKDALLACWVSKCWLQGSLDW